MSRSLVTLVRNLQRRNSRRRETAVILESIRACEEAMRAGVRFTGAVVSDSLTKTARGAALLQAFEQHGIRLEEVDGRTIKQLADTDSPQGVLAIAEPVEWTLDDVTLDRAVRIVVLDGVQDPGNVGTVCRTCFGLGARGVCLLPGTAALNHPKVVRAAMGTMFRLPTISCEPDQLGRWMKDQSVTLWAADAVGEDVRRLDAPERLAIAIGNEGAGLSEATRQMADRVVSIPLAAGADSLNAATAAAILLYEAIR